MDLAFEEGRPEILRFFLDQAKRDQKMIKKHEDFIRETCNDAKKIDCMGHLMFCEIKVNRFILIIHKLKIVLVQLKLHALVT